MRMPKNFVTPTLMKQRDSHSVFSRIPIKQGYDESEHLLRPIALPVP